MASPEETNPKGSKFDRVVPPEKLLIQEHPMQVEADITEADCSAEISVDTIAEKAPAKAPKPERRRRVDPTTFEKQYTDDEIEFMNAMQRFKSQSGRVHPTSNEILGVASKLGYRKSHS